MAQATSTPLTRAERYRAECVRWMTDFEPNLFVTFAINRWVSVDEAQRTFEEFHQRLDRKLLGRSYFDRPGDRTAYIAAIEKPDTNIHIHALFRMTTEQAARFEDVAPGLWTKLIAAGNLDIQPVRHTEGAARYVTKALRPETSDRLLTPPHMETTTKIAA